MKTIEVPLARNAYSVHIGVGAFGDLGAAIARFAPAKVALVTQTHIGVAHPEVADAAVQAGAEVIEVQIPDGEIAKSWDVVGDALERLAVAEMHRRDLVVALGGGVVTDTGGFIAATFLRGVPWIACSTTILGAVDAAVGGKTGVNLRAGKNLAGAFWQPSAVFVDLLAIGGLPERQVRSGLAECVKCGFIRDPEILAALERDGRKIAHDSDALENVIARGVKVKADIVGADEREAGERALLNYGHTFGHALETACGYRLTHGEAIAVGMVFAAELAHARGMIDADVVARHRDILEAIGLPVEASREEVDAAAPLMHRDKKIADTKLRFVLLEDLGDAVIVDDVGDNEIEAALNALLSDS